MRLLCAKVDVRHCTFRYRYFKHKNEEGRAARGTVIVKVGEGEGDGLKRDKGGDPAPTP